MNREVNLNNVITYLSFIEQRRNIITFAEDRTKKQQPESTWGVNTNNNSNWAGILNK